MPEFIAKFIPLRGSASSKNFAGSAAVGKVCGAVCRYRPDCVLVCGSATTITRNCVHRSSPNWVCTKGSDYLQLIKFWPSRAPEKACGGAKIFGSALLQPSRNVCVSSERFFSSDPRYCIHVLCLCVYFELSLCNVRYLLHTITYSLIS